MFHFGAAESRTAPRRKLWCHRLIIKPTQSGKIRLLGVSLMVNVRLASAMAEEGESRFHCT